MASALCITPAKMALSHAPLLESLVYSSSFFLSVLHVVDVQTRTVRGTDRRTMTLFLFRGTLNNRLGDSLFESRRHHRQKRIKDEQEQIKLDLMAAVPSSDIICFLKEEDSFLSRVSHVETERYCQQPQINYGGIFYFFSSSSSSLVFLEEEHNSPPFFPTKMTV